VRRPPSTLSLLARAGFTELDAAKEALESLGADPEDFNHAANPEFIGSDTQLVAPVTVGKGATLGAGTTLTKDAPANQLTLTRVKQVSLNWQRPTKKSK
jgi:hypothetical protein